MLRKRTKKVKQVVPYIWLFWYHGMSVSTLSHKTSMLDGNPPYRMSWFPLQYRRHKKRFGHAGWDIDRQRFFVSSSPSRYPKRSKFRLKNWERNHGFSSSREVPKLHISNYLKKF